MQVMVANERQMNGMKRRMEGSFDEEIDKAVSELKRRRLGETIGNYLFGDCASDEAEEERVDLEEEADTTDEDFVISMCRSRRSNTSAVKRKSVRAVVKKTRSTVRTRHSEPNDWGRNIIDLSNTSSESSDSNTSPHSSLTFNSHSSPNSTLCANYDGKSVVRSLNNTMVRI